MTETRNSSLLGKITVLVVICCCCLSAQGKYGGGTGEPNDPYLIFDANQMNAIGADSNDWDKHFLLCADIDLSDFTGTSFNIIGELYYDEGWVLNPFTGVFDGNGHTISDFTYNSTETDFIGLFGFVDGGEIKNLGLIDPNVDAGTGGSLVGYLKDGTITNSYIKGGSVLGETHVGGLMGENYGGTITNCYSTGGVSGDSSVGGLVGHNGGGGTISNCYSAASVTGDEYVGGLVGSNGDVVCMWVCEPFGGCWLECWSVPGTILNCYSQGDVSGDYEVGGLVGSNSGTITGCYSTGSVTGTTYVGGLLGRNDYGGTITNCYSTGSVAGNDHVGGLVGYNEYGWVIGSFWDIDTSEQTTSAGGTGKTTAEMQTMSTFTDAGWDFVGETANGTEDIWVMFADGLYYPRLTWEFEPSYPGSGTEGDPYQISTPEQMNEIGTWPFDWDKYFILVADIDLSAFTGTSFNIIGYWISWDDYKPFTGVFDGSGRTISNFTYDSNGVNYIGLFGYIYGHNAEIKDLGLIDPSVDAGTESRAVGSLVGSLYSGTITNCYVEGGSVSGVDRVGGLVGQNDVCGTITNCYSTGSVTGDWSVGGLASGNGGTISNCYSTGSVSGNNNVGGLVGNNGGTSGGGGLIPLPAAGTISNCYSNGDVSGNSAVGGLVGSNPDYCEDGWFCLQYGKIYYCYSAGSVFGEENVGGLVGRNEGEIYSSFWDIETSGQTISTGGTGKTTAEMQMQVTFTDAGWDFNMPIWKMCEVPVYPKLWWQQCPLPAPMLHAEPDVTLGTTNTITWDPVPGANDYYAECAEDANFTSIIYNTGWITETSCEFTGLELGQRYWYSVKARNSAGTETNWSNVESSLQGTLADVVDAVETMLDPSSLKNKNMKSALLNKIDEVLEMIDDGLYEDALKKLEHDILQKTNGCTEIGWPDKNDWIITCEQQCQVYPLIIETIEHVKGLME